LIPDRHTPSTLSRLRSALRARTVSAVLAFLVVVVPRVGRAAGSAHARLLYQDMSSTAGCMDEQGLRHEIAARAGYDPILATASDAIVVTVTRTADRVLARVELLDHNGTVLGSRALDAREGDCGELLQAVALSVGIALDRIERGAAAAASDALLPAPSTAPPPGGQALPVQVPPPTPSDEAASDAHATDASALPPTSSRTRWPAIDLAAGLSGWVGMAPAPSLAPTALVSARWGRFDVGLEGRVELPASATEGSTSELVRTSIAGGGPQGCFHLRALFGCAVSFVGSLSAEAPDAPGTAHKTGVDAFAGGRLGGAVPLGAGFSLRLSADLLGRVYAPTVRVAADVWRPSAVAAGSQFAIAWTIP
jgi:hypothetical protein